MNNSGKMAVLFFILLCITAGNIVYAVLDRVRQKGATPEVVKAAPVDPEAWKMNYIGASFRLGDRIGVVTGAAPSRDRFPGTYGAEATVVFQDFKEIRVDWLAIARQHEGKVEK